jgi:hypothetical protein
VADYFHQRRQRDMVVDPMSHAPCGSGGGLSGAEFDQMTSAFDPLQGPG